MDDRRMGARFHLTGRQAKQMSKKLHILLPPRERCTPQASGAIALVVQCFHKVSKYRSEIQIYGGPQAEKFDNVQYTTIEPSWPRFSGLTHDFAVKTARKIPDSIETYVEIHNRVQILQEFRRKHQYSRLVIYLHNDPVTIQGLTTPEGREQVIKIADAVICVSEYVRSRFLEGLNISASKQVHTVLNAVDSTAYTPPLERKSQQQILYVGRIVPEKGVLQLAKALVEILPRYPEWRATFIGACRHGSTKATSYERKVRKLLSSVSMQVDWLGQMPNRSVQRQMHDAAIVVSPSICPEALGLVLLEAMVNGCAVIGSGRGGMSEVMGNVGVVIDPESPSSICQSLKKFMSDPEYLDNKREQGYLHACQHFDIKKQVHLLDDLRDYLLKDTTSSKKSIPSSTLQS